MAKRTLTDGQHEYAARRLMRLQPAAVDPSRVRVDGVRADVTPADIAAAMSGLPSISIHIARALILADDYAAESVRFWLVAVAIEQSHRDGWGREDYGLKQALAGIVAAEIFPPRCPTCKGRRQAPNDRGVPVECPECDGRGVLRMQSAEKAQVMGVSERTWRAVWRVRAERIMRTYERREGECVARIRQRLGY